MTFRYAWTFENDCCSSQTQIMVLLHFSWSDKSCFTCDGVFNNHNSHMCSQVNPHAIRSQTHQELQACKCVSQHYMEDCMFGSYLLPEQISGQSYLAFLQNVLTEFFDNIPLAVPCLWFEHDGTMVNFCAPVHEWLDMANPCHWTGSRDPVLWLP